VLLAVVVLLLVVRRRGLRRHAVSADALADAEPAARSLSEPGTRPETRA